MAYWVNVSLPGLASKFIDPDKLSFVEHTELAEDGSGIFEIVPDHYPKLLAASGRIELASTSDESCERHVHGAVDVSLGWSGKLFEGPVEDAIVQGLANALTAQADQIL